jgi:hypothetical protein
MRGGIRFLENILFFGPYNFTEYDDFRILCTQANSTHQISFKAENALQTSVIKLLTALWEGTEYGF